MSLPAVRTSLDFREIRQETPISIACADGEITMSVQSVLDWICPEAPPQDAMRFLITCRNMRLNPLIGEAFLLPMGKDRKFQIVFPKVAYLKKAQEHPSYDGHESGITVWFRGEFRDEAGTIRPPVEGVVPVGGWAKVWRKGVERPVYKRVSFDEYDKNTHIWQSNPLTMIAKVALVAALREAFGLSGYDESESDHDLPRQVAVTTAHASLSPPATAAISPPAAQEEVVDAVPFTSYRTKDAIGYVRPDLAGAIVRLAGEAKLTEEEFVAMLQRRGVASPGDLTVAQAEEILVALESEVSQAQADEVFGARKGEGGGEVALIPEIVRSGETPS